MKFLSKILFLIALPCVFWAGFEFSNYHYNQQDVGWDFEIPAQDELQIFLEVRGYSVGKHGIDGVVSTDSRKAWDRYINDCYAVYGRRK